MKQYTTPQITTTGTDWFVWFRFTHDGITKLIKRREDINRIKDPKEKLIEIKCLCQARHQWLKDGWNPITDPEFKLASTPINNYKEFTFKEAMLFALKNKKIAKKSFLGYKSVLARILLEADKSLLSCIKIVDFKRFHVLELITQCVQEYNLSNHAYNKYCGIIRALFSVIEDWQIIDFNPASKIKKLKVAESNKYKPITDNEKKTIYGLLIKRKPIFSFYIQMLYYTGLRPKELLSLKIKDISLQNRVIIVEPDLLEENSKTANVRYIAINNHLMPLLVEILSLHPPKEFYLFGSCYAAGGNRGSDPNNNKGVMHVDYFKPSPNRIKRDTVTRLWNTLVKQELGIDKYMYALKHTGANEMIMAGITVEALREMYGHASKITTEIYITRIKEINRKEIIEKSQSFLPSLN